MIDRTLEVVEKQVQAMTTEEFEVGLFKPNSHGSSQPEMVPRVWKADTVIKAVSWLKFQNRDGRNIYIRPKGEHGLSLIDDLTVEALHRMKDSGFMPAVIAETSPGNFQAWMNH